MESILRLELQMLVNKHKVYPCFNFDKDLDDLVNTLRRLKICGYKPSDLLEVEDQYKTSLDQQLGQLELDLLSDKSLAQQAITTFRQAINHVAFKKL